MTYYISAIENAKQIKGLQMEMDKYYETIIGLSYYVDKLRTKGKVLKYNSVKRKVKIEVNGEAITYKAEDFALEILAQQERFSNHFEMNCIF